LKSLVACSLLASLFYFGREKHKKIKPPKPEEVGRLMAAFSFGQRTMGSATVAPRESTWHACCLALEILSRAG
jgi:hypothetical protein